MNDRVRWIATLSNGDMAVQDEGEWVVKTGERSPWVRLTRFAAENDMHLTSLAFDFKGRVIRMPKPKFDKFGLGEKSLVPLFYSLAYFFEADIGDTLVESHHVDLVAHYARFEVHYILDLQDGNNSWVVVTENYLPMAATPRIKE